MILRYLIFDIVFLTLQFLALGLIIAVYAFLLNSNYDYINEMAKNWNYGPVMSFSSSGANCSVSAEFLINDVWPGTVPGCKSLSGTLSRNTCGRKSGGTRISAIKPVRYQIWKGKYLCGPRMTASYLDLSIAKDKNSCPTGERSCGMIDSLSNVLCIPTSSKCPLNYMGYVATGEAYPEGVVVSNILNVTGGALIGSTSATGNGRIINEFKFSEDIPCANPYYKNMNSTPYLLDYYYDRNICKDPLGSELYDYRYTKLDTYYKYEVLRENGILASLRLLPDYSLDYTLTMNLYTRHYIGLTKECHDIIFTSGLSKIILQELSEVGTKITGANGWVLIALCLNAVSTGIYLIIFILIVIFMCGEASIANKLLSVMAGGVATFLCVIAFIFNCVQVSDLYSISDNYQIFNDPGCVDNMTYPAISQNLSFISGAKKISILCLISNLLISIIYLIYLILSCMKRL